MICGEEEWDTFSIIGDCMTAEGDAVSTFAEGCLQLRELGRTVLWEGALDIEFAAA